MRSEGLAYPGNRLPTFAGSHEATGHTAAFPVGLPGWFIRAYSDEGDNVFDPFCGSGSTLIAAEREHRIGYGVEISPGYCDVIVARWERLTGHTAQVVTP
jgi:DNA modification methylase